MATQGPESASPFYVLLSQSCLSPPGASLRSLIHPVIQYHFADDPPLSLLPTSANESVIVLDYDSTSYSVPVARSLAKNMAITRVKVIDAPGASVANDREVKRNDKMYVLDTVIMPDDQPSDEFTMADVHNSAAILAEYKQRNTVLKRVIEFAALDTGTEKITMAEGLNIPDALSSI